MDTATTITLALIILALAGIVAHWLHLVDRVWPAPRERLCFELGHSYRLEWVVIRWRQRSAGAGKRPWEPRSARGRTIVCRRCKFSPLSHDAFELAILRANAGKLPEADWPIIEPENKDAERLARVQITRPNNGGAVNASA